MGYVWGGIALTNLQSPTYHRAMPLKPMIRPSLGAVACFAWLLALAGCEDASKKPVQAHVPALAPALAPASAAPEVGALPLRNLVSQPLITLQAPVPGGIDYLIEKVKEKFSSGEANYQAGHLEAARRDFDDAVDWMLESGYDPTVMRASASCSIRSRTRSTPTNCRPSARVMVSAKLPPFPRPSTKWPK